MKANHSMRKRLILMIGIPLLLTALLIGALSWFSAYEEIEEVYDGQLAHAAKVLLQLTEHEVEEHNAYEIQLGAERNTLKHRYEKKLTFRIWKDTHLVTQSAEAAQFGSFKAPQGYSDQTLAREDWRFFVLYDPQTAITIEVAEKEEVRKDIIFKILAGFLTPLSVFFPLVILIVWLGVTWSLRPLAVLSAQVDQREPGDFSPIDNAHVSQELQSLIAAFNSLLERIRQSFAREQSFTDNAAHELRTPLAAMKTQTQVLLKKVKNPEYQEDLNNLHASIDRTAHMVDQLLSFARLQSEQELEMEEIDFSEFTGRTTQQFSTLLQKKNLKLHSHISDGISLKGHPQALEIMLGNLLDNAIKYTPAGGTITLNLRQNGKEAVFELADTGPGIPDGEKQKVFERFYRSKKGEGSGSGLGLAMVRWACDSHQARIELADNQPNGLLVQVVFSNIRTPRN